MSEERLNNVEYLREKADVSYEEAIEILDRNDGDVTRALIELEKQGRMKGGYRGYTQDRENQCNDMKNKATSFFKKASRKRLVIQRNAGDEKETVLNLSAPVAAGVTILAPYIALGAAALTVVSGYSVQMKDDDKRENNEPADNQQG